MGLAYKMLPYAKWYFQHFLLLSFLAAFFMMHGWAVLAAFFLMKVVYYYRVVLPKYKPVNLEDQIKHEYVVTRDSTTVHYFYIGEDATNGDRTIILANGMGCLFSYWSIPVAYFVTRGYRIVSWDYRGQFGSSNPESKRTLSMRDLALDCGEIMEHMGMKKCAIILGWSTGVQVGLEFAALYPDRVGRLVLVCGNHGHTFSGVLQPLWRMPITKEIYHSIAGVLLYFVPYRQFVLNQYIRLAPFLRRTVLEAWAISALQPGIPEHINQYVMQLLGNGDEHFTNFILIGQELDAHSVYHFLRKIQTPTTLVSGCMDILTPCYQMYDMEALMPNVRHLNYLFLTHFIILEDPDLVTRTLEEEVEKYDNMIEDLKMKSVASESQLTEEKPAVAVKELRERKKPETKHEINTEGGSTMAVGA